MNPLLATLKTQPAAGRSTPDLLTLRGLHLSFLKDTAHLSDTLVLMSRTQLLADNRIIDAELLHRWLAGDPAAHLPEFGPQPTQPTQSTTPLTL